MTNFIRGLRFVPGLLCLVWCAPAAAELVILPEGGFMRVTSYEVEDDLLHVTLASGGRMTMPLLRIERIIADEFVEPPIEEPEIPRFSLRFDESQAPPDTPYGDLIYSAAERHSLNPRLLAAVVRAESAFDPRAISPKGARGLMQLMPATAQRFGLKSHEVFEPAKSLDAGARYLDWLAKRFDERLSWVLAAYNAGEGTVDRYKGVPPYRETRNYLRRIYAALGLSEEELASAEEGSVAGAPEG